MMILWILIFLHTMKHIKTFTVLSVSFFLFQSCVKTDPDPINAIIIDQDFEVFPSQKLGADGSEFYLSINATEVDSCLNNILDAQMSVEGSNILVQINDIIKPEFCEEGLHLLEKEFLFPSGNMTYDVEFMKADFLSTSGKITITEDGIELDIDNLGGVFVTESKLSKIKPNHIWGFFIKGESGMVSLVYELDEVEQEFILSFPILTRLGEGNYSYFEIESSGNVIIPEVKEIANSIAVEISDITKWIDFKNNLDRYATAFPGLKYHFTIGSGEMYSNI